MPNRLSAERAEEKIAKAALEEVVEKDIGSAVCEQGRRRGRYRIGF